MAIQKDRIMDLMRRGVITEEEALELLESSNEGDSESQEAPKAENKKNTQTSTDGYNNHDIDFPDALKNVASQIADGARELFRGLSKAVDDNIEFGNGFPKVKSTSHRVEKDIEGDFDKIKVDVKAGKLSVKPGNNAHVKVEYKIYGAIDNGDAASYLESKSKLGVEGDTLEISVEDNLRTAAYIELYLPEKAYKALEVKLAHGDVKVEKTAVESFELNLINGEIEVSGVNSDKTDISSKNGNIKVEGGRADLLKVSLVNGNLRLTPDFETGDVSLVNGNVLLTETAGKARELKVKNVNGDIKLSVPESLGLVGHVKATFGGYKTRLRLDQPFESGRNGAAIVRSGEQSLTLELETKSGSIWLKDSENKED